MLILDIALGIALGYAIIRFFPAILGLLLLATIAALAYIYRGPLLDWTIGTIGAAAMIALAALLLRLYYRHASPRMRGWLDVPVFTAGRRINSRSRAVSHRPSRSSSSRLDD